MSHYPKLTVEKSLHVGSWDPTHKPPFPPPDIPGLTTINGPCWYGAGLNPDNGWIADKDVNEKINGRVDKSVLGIIPPTLPRYTTLGIAPVQRSEWPITGEWYGPLADAFTISKRGNPGLGEKNRYDGVGIRVNANAHKIEGGELVQIRSEKLVEIKSDEKIEEVCPKIDLVEKRGNQNQPLYVGGNAYFDHPNIGDLSDRFNTADARPKPFDMVHPTLGEGHRLRYACIEGPEVGVYFRGRLKGETEIQLPSYWKDLVHTESISVQLQPIGTHQSIIVKEWDENKVVLESDKPIDCFYHVYAERKDVNSVVVEYTGDSWKDYPDPQYDDPQYANKINTVTT